MDYTNLLTAAQALEFEERYRLAEALWEQIEEESANQGLTDELRAELLRRAAAHKANPADVIPWEEVKASLLARGRS